MWFVLAVAQNIPLEMPSVLRKRKKLMGTWFVTCVSVKNVQEWATVYMVTQITHIMALFVAIILFKCCKIKIFLFLQWYCITEVIKDTKPPFLREVISLTVIRKMFLEVFVLTRLASYAWKRSFYTFLKKEIESVAFLHL